MQTLEFKAPEKRIRSANETLNIFVPLAYFIGAFRLKCELEDICLSYLDKESYDALKEKENFIVEDYKECVKQATEQVLKETIGYSNKELKKQKRIFIYVIIFIITSLSLIFGVVDYNRIKYGYDPIFMLRITSSKNTS